MRNAIRWGTAACAASILVLALGAGCKKSVKGEESRWTSANKQADEVGALYPGFKKAIEARRAEAKAIYDAAQKISDEEQKISKLNQANRTLDGGFVDGLSKVDDAVKQLQARLVDAAGAKVEGADRAKVDAAVAEVKKALAMVDGKLRRGAADASGADAVVKQIHKDLDDAGALLTRALPVAAPPPPTQAQGADTPAQPQPWTCEFCDHVNEPGADTCANCGAARPAPDPAATK